MNHKNEKLKQILQELNIPEESMNLDLIKNQGLFEATSEIVKKYIKENLKEFNLSKPSIEGESKKIHSWKNFALIELKPTMYSFTHNRYGIVENTDNLRLDFWNLFATRINTIVSDNLIDKKNKFSNKINDLFSAGIIKKEFPFISNYLGEITVNNTRYAITRFAKEIPHLEVVWKNYLVGTMKHNLKEVDQHTTKYQTKLLYEKEFPKDIIRFDWRNPLPDKDECIPDEFADFYLDTKSAREVARLTSHIINFILQEKGYELIDLCYFMNYEGNGIYSEITPDGMRIRKKGKSFDKDLWRSGKDVDTINQVWKELLTDLRGE